MQLSLGCCICCSTCTQHSKEVDPSSQQLQQQQLQPQQQQQQHCCPQGHTKGLSRMQADSCGVSCAACLRPAHASDHTRHGLPDMRALLCVLCSCLEVCVRLWWRSAVWMAATVCFHVKVSQQQPGCSCSKWALFPTPSLLLCA